MSIAVIGTFWRRVGQLLPEPLYLILSRRRLMLRGELVMEPSSNLGRTRMIGPMSPFGVSIGRNSHWGSGLCWGRVHIGCYCSIGPNVSIGANRHPMTWLSTSFFIGHETFSGNDVDTVIGNDVWIGENAIVMKGVHVGDGAVIGTSAVVTHDVPAWAIVVGVPAHLLRYRFDERTRQRLAAIQWWNLGEDRLRKLDVKDVEACLSALEQPLSGAKEDSGGAECGVQSVLDEQDP